MKLHGMDTPLPVVKAASKPSTEPLRPEEGEALFRRNDECLPVYGVVFWVASSKSPNAPAMKVDLLGNVSPNIRVMAVRNAMSGVMPDKINPKTALDYTEFMHRQQSEGMVRVDHLKDGEGVPLGLPDEETYHDREKLRDWAWGILDVDRLRQLHRELGECEDGRGLAGTSLRMQRRIKLVLSRTRDKSEAQRKADEAALKMAEAKLQKASARIQAALKPAPKGGKA